MTDQNYNLIIQEREYFKLNCIYIKVGYMATFQNVYLGTMNCCQQCEIVSYKTVKNLYPTKSETCRVKKFTQWKD